MKLKLSIVLISILLFSGCSSKKQTLNNPADAYAPVLLRKPLQSKNNTSLILTFSGGGTRAAAFSYGVLKGLKDHHLLDNIDIISSVSGGSFTAAYFGLYGEGIFKDFESKFLKKKIQTRLLDSVLNPFNWFDYAFSNRSDHAAKIYEEEVFGQKHFSDLRDRPKLIINATDISTGNAFTFTEENFARICSNLSSYPIGKAVTASSAVPGAFSPITLKNYDTCSINQNKTNKKTLFYYNEQQTQGLNKLQDKKNYPYLHLVDGVITDNLGIRSLLQIISKYDNNFLKLSKDYSMSNVDKIVFIVVNAADSLDPKIALIEDNPSIDEVLNATSTIQIKRYNSDTLDILRKYAKLWQTQVKKSQNRELKFYLVELNFNQLPRKKAKIFSRIKTSLELEPGQVDGLIRSGKELLEGSKEFQRFIKDYRH